MRRGLWIALSVTLWAASAQAAVIDTQEWTARPGNPWSYTQSGATVDPAPACGGGSSPSGGSALVFIYAAGTYSTSFSAGRAERAISPSLTELYFGHWNCYSSNFVWHPNGTKMDFFISSAGSLLTGLVGQHWNFACGFAAPAANQGCTVQQGWAPYGNNPCNISACVNTRDTWQWHEWRVKVNTPGQADGEFDLWIDNVLKSSYRNIKFLDSTMGGGFGSLQHTAEYGGGGSTLLSTQKWWVDHTVLSTTRIGRPGGVSSGDTTPPSTPANFTLH